MRCAALELLDAARLALQDLTQLRRYTKNNVTCERHLVEIIADRLPKQGTHTNILDDAGGSDRDPKEALEYLWKEVLKARQGFHGAPVWTGKKPGVHIAPVLASSAATGSGFKAKKKRQKKAKPAAQPTGDIVGQSFSPRP